MAVAPHSIIVIAATVAPDSPVADHRLAAKINAWMSSECQPGTCMLRWWESRQPVTRCVLSVGSCLALAVAWITLSTLFFVYRPRESDC